MQVKADIYNLLVELARYSDACFREACNPQFPTTPQQWSYCASLASDAVLKLKQNTADAYTADTAFDGNTYDPGQDFNRLSKQLGRVYQAMMDGKWRTAEEVANITGDTSCSLPALTSRIRDLRKPRHGNYVVRSRRRSGGGGVWEYQLLSPSGDVITAPNPIQYQYGN